MEPVKQVTFERTYEAPVATIWHAWTDPETLKKWWGPNGVVIPECEVDLQVGGRFYIVMQATEEMGEAAGIRWPMEGAYTAVEENAKLSYDAKAWTEGDEEGTEIDQTTEVILSEEGGKTKVNVIATIHKTGPKAGMAVQGMEWGYNQQFDKLAAFLSQSA